MNKCPHCNQAFTRVNIGNLPAANLTGSWHAVSYNCPHCHASLGVEIDPIALRTDTVNMVIAELRKSR